MSRQSLNITITGSMQQARVSERLDALAAHTALAPTWIAARALQLGLTQIEADPQRLFPGASQPSPAEQPADPQPDAVPISKTQASESIPADPKHAAATPQRPKRERSPRAHAAPDQPEASASEPTDAGSSATLVTTKEAAVMLGHPSSAALREHVKRHPVLKRWQRPSGRDLLWDIGGLREDYDLLGFRLLGPRSFREQPDRPEVTEPATLDSSQS